MVDYQEYLESPEWAVKKEEALRRAGHKCEKCSGDKKLQVHHLSYDRLGDELPEDLQSLCVICHRQAHGITGLIVKEVFGVFEDDNGDEFLLPFSENRSKKIIQWLKQEGLQ